jgi:hypothetical protein
MLSYLGKESTRSLLSRQGETASRAIAFVGGFRLIRSPGRDSFLSIVEIAESLFDMKTRGITA